MCRLHLDHIPHLEEMIAKLETQVGEMMEPFRAQRELLITIPGVGPPASAAIIFETGADVPGHFPTAEQLASGQGCAQATTSAQVRRFPQPAIQNAAIIVVAHKLIAVIWLIAVKLARAGHRSHYQELRADYFATRNGNEKETVA